MTFFNRKEDVIKIELTPHGRKLLSQGKLKPFYYAFFDDDILYDSNRGGFSETNLESKGRILSGSVYMRPQTNYKGVESKLEDRRSFETENHLLYPIGSNKIEEKKSNGWSVSFLHNTASSATNTLSGDSTPTLSIPQVECTVQYELSIGSVTKATAGKTYNPIMPEQRLTGDSFIDIKEDQILAHMMEKNGFNIGGSLEIEVFLYDQDEQNTQKLSFLEQDDLIVNNILTDPNDLLGALYKAEAVADDPKFVEYWLRIRTDKKIPILDRCSGIQNLKAQDIYLDVEIDCPDRDADLGNIYNTTPIEIEECEE